MRKSKWDIFLTKRAEKALEKANTYKANIYIVRINKLIEILRDNPYVSPFEKLQGYKNVYSRRINIQHRLVYQIFEKEHTIKIISVWGHYDDN